jgi:hypothetical protein
MTYGHLCPRAPTSKGAGYRVGGSLVPTRRLPAIYVEYVRSDYVDPRDTEWENPDPVYRVYFWHRQAPPAGIRAESMGWQSEEHRLTEAADVHEVIAWAEQRLPSGDRYVLYVEQSDRGLPGLIRLAGTDPTEDPNPLAVSN